MIPLHYKLKEQIKLFCPLPPKQCGTLQIIGIHKQEPRWYGSEIRKDIMTGLYKKSLISSKQCIFIKAHTYSVKQIEGQWIQWTATET